jgi:hypothetical protein
LGFLARKQARFWLDNTALNWIESLLHAKQSEGTIAAQVASV